MNNDERYVQNMLQRADRILADVDEAYIVQERGFASRPMPTFRPEEISLGKVLGKGGFGIVHEIKGFCLDEEVVADSDQPADEQQQDDSHVHYEIQHARQLMKRKAHNQKGSARYALKILHGDLTKVEHTRGMIDLALEAKYLSIVWHPNISEYPERVWSIVCLLMDLWSHPLQSNSEAMPRESSWIPTSLSFSIDSTKLWTNV